MDIEEVKQKLTVLLRKLMKDKQAYRHLENYLRDAIPATKGKLTALMVEANDEQLEEFTVRLELSLERGNLMSFRINYTLKDTAKLDAAPKPEQKEEEDPHTHGEDDWKEDSVSKVMADAIWPHLETRITELVKKLCPVGGGGDASAESVKTQLLDLLNSASSKA